MFCRTHLAAGKLLLVVLLAVLVPCLSVRSPPPPPPASGAYAGFLEQMWWNISTYGYSATFTTSFIGTSPNYTFLIPYANNTVMPGPWSMNLGTSQGVFLNWGATLFSFFNADVSGSYTFHVASDNGAQLYLNSSLLIDNSGSTGIGKTIQATTTLPVGYYNYTVAYNQGKGTAGLVLTYNTSSTALQVSAV
ncbi:TPA: hypothetical protein ACH3X1_007839 [Trebouxia sp. C0004]